MTTPFYSLEQLDAMYKIEQDWGVKEYVSELGFQLAEKNQDIHICYMDIKPAYWLPSSQARLPGLKLVLKKKKL